VGACADGALGRVNVINWHSIAEEIISRDLKQGTDSKNQFEGWDISIKFQVVDVKTSH
jgi:hypothetical protein